MRREQAIHQALQAVRLFDDDLRVFAQLALRQLVLKQLRRTTNAAQRIFDFMREIANQIAMRTCLLQKACLTLNFQLLVDRAQLNHHASAAARLQHGRNHAMHRHRLVRLHWHVRIARREREREVLGAVAPFLIQGSSRTFDQNRRVAEEPRQWLVLKGFCGDGEECFSRWIGMHNAQISIGEQHGGGEQGQTLHA